MNDRRVAPVPGANFSCNDAVATAEERVFRLHRILGIVRENDELVAGEYVRETIESELRQSLVNLSRLLQRERLPENQTLRRLAAEHEGQRREHHRSIDVR